MNPRSTRLSAFPHTHAGGPICYMKLEKGVLTHCRFRNDLRQAVAQALVGQCEIYAVFPRQSRSDLFIVDDLENLAKTIQAKLENGMTMKSEDGGGIKCKYVIHWEQHNIIECEVETGSGDAYCPEHRVLVDQFIRNQVGHPEVVVLCGSTRFYDEFQKANYDLTMQGKIVLSVGFYPHSKAKAGHGEGVGHDSHEKTMLDELHKRKIDLADRVFVLNVGGYIGELTKSEIEYALDHGKPIDWLEVVE